MKAHVAKDSCTLFVKRENNSMLRRRPAYNCYKCNYKASDSANVIAHMVSIHKILKPKMYQCFTCKSRYRTPAELNMHKKDCIAVVNSTPIITHNAKIEVEINKQPQINLKRIKKPSYKMKLIISDKSNVTSKKVMNRLSPLKIKPIGKKKYKCVQCNFTSSNAFHIHRHVQLVHKIKSSKRFENISMLNGHLKTNCRTTEDVPPVGVTNNKEEMECPKCSFRSYFPDNLRRHVDIVHGNINPKVYKCDCCMKLFQNLNIFQSHVQNGCLKPEIVDSTINILQTEAADAKVAENYQCTQCSFRSENRSLLRNHIKSEHKKESPTAFKCTICAESFQYITEFKCHVMKCKKLSGMNGETPRRSKSIPNLVSANDTASGKREPISSNMTSATSSVIINRMSRHSFAAETRDLDHPIPKGLHNGSAHANPSKEDNFERQRIEEPIVQRKLASPVIRVPNPLARTQPRPKEQILDRSHHDNSQTNSPLEKHLKEVPQSVIQGKPFDSFSLMKVPNPLSPKKDFNPKELPRRKIGGRFILTRSSIRAYSLPITTVSPVSKEIATTPKVVETRVESKNESSRNNHPSEKRSKHEIELYAPEKSVDVIENSEVAELYSCLHCDYKSPYTWSVGNHMKKTHKISHPKIHKCKFCGEMLRHLRDLRNHMTETFCVNTNKEFAEQIKSSIKKRRYNCSHCSYKTAYSHAIRGHLNKIHEVSDAEFQRCFVCDDIFMSVAHLHGHDCGRNASSVVAVKSYVAPMTKEQKRKRYHCFRCPFKSAYAHHVRNHLQRKHSVGLVKFQCCPTCNLVFTEKAQFQKHVCVKPNAYKSNVAHSEEFENKCGPVFVCKMCEKIFDDRNNYNNHIKLAKCSKQFTRNNEGKIFGKPLVNLNVTLSRLDASGTSHNNYTRINKLEPTISLPSDDEYQSEMDYSDEEMEYEESYSPNEFLESQQVITHNGELSYFLENQGDSQAEYIIEENLEAHESIIRQYLDVKQVPVKIVSDFNIERCPKNGDQYNMSSDIPSMPSSVVADSDVKVFHELTSFPPVDFPHRSEEDYTNFYASGILPTGIVLKPSLVSDTASYSTDCDTDANNSEKVESIIFNSFDYYSDLGNMFFFDNVISEPTNDVSNNSIHIANDDVTLK